MFRAFVSSRGVGKTTKGEVDVAASCSSKSGNAVEGEAGSKVRIGLGESVELERGNSEASPRGIKRRISPRASSES